MIRTSLLAILLIGQHGFMLRVISPPASQSCYHNCRLLALLIEDCCPICVLPGVPHPGFPRSGDLRRFYKNDSRTPWTLQFHQPYPAAGTDKLDHLFKKVVWKNVHWIPLLCWRKCIYYSLQLLLKWSSEVIIPRLQGGFLNGPTGAQPKCQWKRCKTIANNAAVSFVVVSCLFLVSFSLVVLLLCSRFRGGLLRVCAHPSFYCIPDYSDSKLELNWIICSCQDVSSLRVPLATEILS